MSRFDEICRDAVTQLDGGLSCSFLEVGTGRLLGGHVRSEAGTTHDPGTTALVALLLGSPALARLVQLIRARLGAPLGSSGTFDEVYISGSHQLFVRQLQGGRHAVVLEAGAATPVAWGWLRTRSAARLAEPEIN